MRIAVTGANGHIGNVVCRMLLERGYAVNALVHSNAKALKGLNVDVFEGSVLNPADLHRLLAGCEVVIHCAAIISIDGDPKGEVFRTNTSGPQHILDVALAQGVRRIIHISSAHAVQELPHHVPFDESRPYKTAEGYPYDYSKALGEQILLNGAQDRDIEVIIHRPACVLGPFDFKPSMMGAALIDFYKEKVPLLPPGGYDLVDVRDVVRSVLQTIELGQHGDIFLLTGTYYTFKDFARVIQKVTGKKVPKTVVPYWLIKGFLPVIRLYASFTGQHKSFTMEAIDAVQYGHPEMNGEKARKILHHTARPLEETLMDFYAWIQENKRGELL